MKNVGRRTRKRLNSLGKILFVFIQLTSSIPSNFGTAFPSPFSSFLVALGIAGFDLPLETFIGCLFRPNHYTEVFVATLAPVGILTVTIAFYSFMYFRASEAAADYKQVLRGSGQGAMLLVCYVFVPVTSRSIFGCFQCDHFDDGSNLLAVDYSLSCEDSMYTAMVIYASIMVLIWPIGGPLLFACTLYPRRKDLSGDTLTASRLAASRPEALEEEIIEGRDLDASLNGIRVLFDSYRPTTWFWEVVVMMRRLVLTGAIVVLPRGSVSQCTVGIFMCILAVILQQTYRPYIEPTENIVAFLVEVNLIILIYIVLLFSLNATTLDGLQGDSISVILLILTVLVIGLGITLMIITTCYPPERDQFETGALVVATAARSKSTASQGGLGRPTLGLGATATFRDWENQRQKSSFFSSSEAEDGADEAGVEMPSVQRSRTATIGDELRSSDGVSGNPMFVKGKEEEEEKGHENEEEHNRRKSDHVIRLSENYRPPSKKGGVSFAPQVAVVRAAGKFKSSVLKKPEAADVSVAQVDKLEI